MDQTARDLICLAASAVNGTEVDPQRAAAMDLSALFSLASFHHLCFVTACALEAAGVEDPCFRTARRREAIRQDAVAQELNAVCAALEQAGVWYVPLKGAVLKTMYPESGMREMSDCDLLYDEGRRETVREIMASLGFEQRHEEVSYHDTFWKPPFCRFEMHTALLGERAEPMAQRALAGVPERLQGEGCRRSLTKEDFYLFMIAHDHKHYHWAGLGLRALLDIYVFLSREGGTLDKAAVRAGLKRMGMRDFERQERSLAFRLFAPGPEASLTPEEEDALAYYLTSGAKGTINKRIQNDAERAGIGRYLWRRIFLPMPEVEANYPFFSRHRVLLPLLPLYRMIRRWPGMKREVSALRSRKKRP